VKKVLKYNLLNNKKQSKKVENTSFVLESPPFKLYQQVFT